MLTQQLRWVKLNCGPCQRKAVVFNIPSTKFAEENSLWLCSCCGKVYMVKMTLHRQHATTNIHFLCYLTYSLGSEGPVQSFLPRNKECRRTSYITKNICFCLRFFKISSKTWSHNISPYRSAWFDRCYDISHGSLVWSALKSPRMQAHTCTNSDHIYLVSVLGTGIYFSNSPVLQRWWVVL